MRTDGLNASATGGGPGEEESPAGSKRCAAADSAGSAWELRYLGAEDAANAGVRVTSLIRLALSTHEAPK
jgi:hypothetical protein